MTYKNHFLKMKKSIFGGYHRLQIKHGRKNTYILCNLVQMLIF